MTKPLHLHTTGHGPRAEWQIIKRVHGPRTPHLQAKDTSAHGAVATGQTMELRPGPNKSMFAGRWQGDY